MSKVQTIYTNAAERTDKLVIVERRTVYGVDKIYPVCDRAIIFADMVGTKTLTNATIEGMRDLGFSIIEKHGRSIWPASAAPEKARL